jgi:hypothetical protein
MAFDPLTGQWTPSWKTASGFANIGTASPGGESLADYIAARTPREDWANLMADLPADPRWERGLESLRGRMLGRYYLAEPYIGRGYGTVDQPGYVAPEADPDTSFARFMGDIGRAPGYGQDYTGLRARAALAAQAARTPVSGVGKFADDPIMQQYYGTFGPTAEDAFGRQQAVATMLAQQRTGAAGTGAYRGRMGEAIARAMQSIARSRLASGAPQTDFLDWYLQQTSNPMISIDKPLAVDPIAGPLTDLELSDEEMGLLTP